MVSENNYKYLKAPTIEQIEAVVKKTGVSEAQFERFHSIYDGAITHVRIGFRELPSSYWHIFLDPSTSTNKQTNRKPVKTPKQRTNTKPTGTLSNLLS